jgi:hypothetical protein
VIWSVVNTAIILGLGILCVFSVRQACVAALEMLKGALESAGRDEINYLRGEVSTLQTQLLAVQHPTTHARLEAQKEPKVYDKSWESFPAARRNPQQFRTTRMDETPEVEVSPNVPRSS